MSTQWNRQHNRYESKVIKCLEQNIGKQIDCKRSSNTKQMNRLQNIRIELWKYKAVRKYKTQPSKVSICSFFSAYLCQYSIILY